MGFFADQLGRLMTGRRLTATDAAGLTGERPETIQEWLDGDREPKDREAVAIALGADPDYFTPWQPARKEDIQMSVEEAARRLHMTPAWIRKGLQDRVFPWGYAVKMSGGRWSYFISRPRFTEEVRA